MTGMHDMKIIRITKQDWEAGIPRLKEEYRLFGPVKEKDFHLFARLDDDVLPDLNYTNTRLSPKGIIYPQTETLLKYNLDPESKEYAIPKETLSKDNKQAIVGIRPCDAYAFELVKLNFDTPDYKDPYWLAAYESTVLVGLGCDNPCKTCFCTSCGTGPYSEKGLDILLSDCGDHYLAKLLSPRGEALAQAAGWDTPAPDDAPGVFDNKASDAEKSIMSSVKTEKLAQQDLLALYNAPFWDEISFACINCGTCTYSCPTCWCFDIQDEIYGKEAVRLRNWDSCMYPLFTLHASGHNPRGTKTHRVRQRFMHKLKYFVDKYENGIHCVGCGRCVNLCPVSIDIREICNMANDYEPATTA